MPLLGDSKSVYVGTTPITKVMSAGVQVWPKGTPPPVGPFDRLSLYRGTETTSNIGLFLSWETINRPSSCARGVVYTVQEFNQDPAVSAWYDFVNWNDPRGYNWMPSAYPNLMVMYLGPDSSDGIFRLKYESAPGMYQYSSEVEDAPNIYWSRLPTDYQQDECNGKPNP